MRWIVISLVACATASGCAASKEKLAKCAADENPVGLASYAQGEAAAVNPLTQYDDCGPMRPVNSF